jgi:hypothetical protein
VPVDGRPSSPTFNQTLPLISFTNETIITFAIDQTRNRLYVTTRVTGSNPVQSQIRIIDINPANATFNQSVGSVALPGGQQAAGIAVNSVTNKIYVTSYASGGGVFVLNGANQNLTLIPETFGAFGGVAINEATNMIYTGKTGPNGIFSIDGATDTLSATVSLPNFSLGNFGDSFIAINTATGRIYLVSSDSSLTVLDGVRSNSTFNTIIGTIPNVGNHRIALDESTNKIIVTSNSFKTTIVDGTTNTIAATTFGNMTSADLVVNPVTRRAYIAYVFYGTQAINLNDNSYTYIETTVELGETIVNRNNNFFYFPRNRTVNDISFLNTNDNIGSVTGLPHGFGRTIFSAQNSATNRFIWLTHHLI